MASGTRIRYKRLSAAGGACAVTLVAVLGGAGVLPVESPTRPVAHQAATWPTPHHEGAARR